MKKSGTKQPNKKQLLRALNANLGAIDKTPWVRSLTDGREYVCSVCNLEVKPCDAQPGAMCGHMLREGTDAALLEDALKNPDAQTYGVCSSCGKRLSPAQLKKNPTAELCSDCARKEQRVHASRPDHA
jgi:hypothetical protein